MINEDELKERLSEYEDIINTPIIEKCNYIVEIGALTVTTDDNNVIKLHNVEYPTQFTEKAVEKIKTCGFTNCHNEKVIPKVFLKNEWYTERIESLKSLLKIIDKL